MRCRRHQEKTMKMNAMAVREGKEVSAAIDGAGQRYGLRPTAREP